MYGIPFIDAPAACTRLARSALPHAPVIQVEHVRLVRGGLKRATAIGSRHG